MGEGEGALIPSSPELLQHSIESLSFLVLDEVGDVFQQKALGASLPQHPDDLKEQEASVVLQAQPVPCPGERLAAEAGGQDVVIGDLVCPDLRDVPGEDSACGGKRCEIRGGTTSALISCTADC